MLREGAGWEPVRPVKNDGADIATASTRALPLAGSEIAAPRVTALRRSDVLVLMSDGVGDPLHDGKGSVGRFLAAAWARPPAPIEFAAQVDFARSSHDDDRTAVAIWPV